jgi:cholesterol transport system auxiliary component
MSKLAVTKTGDPMRALHILKLATPALALLLAGCLSFGPKVPDTMLRLTPVRTAAAGAGASGQLGQAIVVLDPETDQRLAVQRVPVQIDDSNIAYVKELMWVDKPARLFRGLLAETLRARGGRLVFEGTDAEGASSQRVYGRILDMGYDARTSSVVVRFDAVREGANGAVVTRRFESIVPGIAPEAEFIGPALNQAANNVAGQVADWVG